MTPGDFERQETVVEQDPGADLDVAGEVVVRGGNLVRRGLGLGREDDPLARLEAERRRQIADPDPGPLQVEQDGRRVAAAGEHLTQAADPAGADLRRAVRRVDADHVDARVEQRGHLSGLVP